MSQKKFLVTTLAAVLLIFVALTSPAQKKSAIFSPDKGTFKIQLDGQNVGHEEFSITPSDDAWIATGTKRFLIKPRYLVRAVSSCPT